MSAISTAPLMEADVEVGESNDFESQPLGHDVEFATTNIEETSFFSAETLIEDGSALPAQAPFYPLPVQPEATSASAENSELPEAQPLWDAPPNAPLPGEVLLGEFDALYHKYERRVYRQCFRILGNRDDAEDLTQEVFMQLYRKVHTFRGTANFSTWLHRLTLNTVLMQLRRYRRWRDTVTSLDHAPGSEDEVSDLLTTVNTARVPATTTFDKLSLDLAIAQLPPGYKEIFILHDAEGYRHEEIAKLLGISEGTSKSQLHKARLRLRTLIGSARTIGPVQCC